MLLEPRRTRLITDSRHPSQLDLEEPVSGNSFFKTKQGQAINQSINQSIVYLSNQPNRIFQLTKAFKVATPHNRGIREELDPSQILFMGKFGPAALNFG